MANKNDIRRKTVGDVCRFILFSTQSRKPIKKTDITAIIRKANIAKSQDIIDAAKQKLSQGFGFDLVEAPNKTSYFIVVKHGNNENEQQRNLRGRVLNHDEELKKYRGLVSVVLQLLILHGNKCEKGTFNHELFDKMDTSMFGSTKQIIQELKQQKWIEEVKESGDERVYYQIGPRGNIETQSEWQYIAAYQLVNGMMPQDNDRALQRIAQEKQNANRFNRNNRNNRNNRARSGTGSQRRRGRGGGRRRG